MKFSTIKRITGAVAEILLQPLFPYQMLPLSNSSTRSHPRVSVTLAAVTALIALPTPGIQPTSAWDKARPTVEVVMVPMVANAVDSVKVFPKTRPKEIVIVIWMGTMAALSLPGSCASPAPIPAHPALAA